MSRNPSAEKLRRSITASIRGMTRFWDSEDGDAEALAEAMTELRRNGQRHLQEALATERRLTVERAFAAMQRVKRSPRKTNAEWQPEDIAFDVGVAAAQDAVRSILREGDDLATADVDEEAGKP